MRTAILVSGFCTFALCWCVHVMMWRSRRPKNDILVLFSIFIFLPMIAFCSGLILAWTQNLFGISSLEFCAVVLLHAALSCAYIQTYPCAQAESPSLAIMLIVARHGSNGISGKEISGHFDDGKLVHSRFQDLINSSLIREKDGAYFLSGFASGLLQFFILYRKILGLGFKTG